MFCYWCKNFDNTGRFFSEGTNSVFENNRALTLRREKKVSA